MTKRKLIKVAFSEVATDQLFMMRFGGTEHIKCEGGYLNFDNQLVAISPETLVWVVA